jgi:Zn finger protein HypA/HybF involved in hydrogenase expression
MAQRNLNPDAMTVDEDWEGNNAAFKCPRCGKIFIVSGHLHPNGRSCPECKQSEGHVKGARQNGGEAYIKWIAGRVHQAVDEEG